MLGKVMFFVILLVMAVALIFSTTSKIVLAAENTTNTTTLDVNVSQVVQITLVPSSLVWTLVGAGTMGGYKNLTIKNTGSVNVTQVYSYVDTIDKEPTNPYGSSNATKYAASGVILATIMNETNISKYYYLGRLEWNWTEDIPNHNWGNISSPRAWGYFRNLSTDYVWVVGNGTNSSADAGSFYCNNTGAQFAIEDNADLGTYSTRSPEDDSITQEATMDNNWSYFRVSRATAPLNKMCVAVYYDCSKIYVYNFDKRGTVGTDFGVCQNSDYLFGGNLVPGNTFMVRLDPWIPRGIPSGDMRQSVLTVVATSTP